MAGNFTPQRIHLFLALLFVLFVGIVTTVWYAWCCIFNTGRALAILLAVDRLGNVAMGQGNETISSWEGRRNGPLEKPINWLFSKLGLGEDHCDNNRE